MKKIKSHAKNNLKRPISKANHRFADAKKSKDFLHYALKPVTTQSIIFEKKQEEYSQNNIAMISDSGITNITQPTELGETIKELNKDRIEGDINMSGIDLRSRLHEIEISGILQLDTLVALKFLPKEMLSITRQKKRLNVSHEGKGREEIVNIVAGKREQEKASGMFSKIGNMFSGGDGGKKDGNS